MENAVHPTGNPITDFFKVMKSEQEGTFDALKEKDEMWSQFGNSSFYGLVKDYIDRLIQKMDDLEGEAFEKGASSDEIVMRRAVVRLTKANLKSLTNKVDGTTRQLAGAGASVS